MSEQTEFVAGSPPQTKQHNTNAGTTTQRLDESRDSGNGPSSTTAKQNESYLDLLLGSMPSGKSQAQRLRQRALRLHARVRPDAALQRQTINNYFVEEEGTFEVGDDDWSVYRLLDADANAVYSAVGELGEEAVFVFDNRGQPVISLADYVPQTKLGRLWLTYQIAKTPDQFARFVSGRPGTLFVKLNPPWERLELFDFAFRNVVEETVSAALAKHSLGEWIRGEGESSMWFRTSDLELGALIVERTLGTYGLLQGSAIMDIPDDDAKMPQVFYPRHRRRVVTEWGY